MAPAPKATLLVPVKVSVPVLALVRPRVPAVFWITPLKLLV